MITTKISITPYLAEYIIGKYNHCNKGEVKIPDTTDLYHVIWEYMSRRPDNVSVVDTGNLIIALPDRRIGKDPAVFNYLSVRAVKVIEQHIKNMFNQELHSELMDNDRRGHFLDNIDVVHKFLCTYGIESISEDALLKNYYRYREALRQRKKRKERREKLCLNERKSSTKIIY